MVPDTDLVPVLEELGIEVTQITDQRIHALCPMHEQITGQVDRHPSWSIDRTLRVHHCFACGYKGTLRGLIADVLGLSGTGAVHWLWDHGLEIIQRELRAPSPAKAPIEAPKPLEGLLDEFCDPPDKALARRQLERFAVVHFGVKWDAEDRSWILPIRRDNGELIGYQRKRKHRVRNHPPKIRKRDTLFGIEQFRPGDRAILVESPLDVVRLYSEGITGGLSSFGVIVSDEQKRLLLKYTDELVLALDNDQDGRIHTERLWRQWSGAFRLWVITYAGISAKDIGEMDGPQISDCLKGAELSVQWRPEAPPQSVYRPRPVPDVADLSRRFAQL